MGRKIKVLIFCLLIAGSVSGATINGGTFANFTPHGRSNRGYFRSFWLTFYPTTVTPPVTGVFNSSVVQKDRTYDSTTTTQLSDILWNYTYEADRKQTLPITRGSSNNGVIAPSGTDTHRWVSASVGTATLTISTSTQNATATVTTGSTAQVLAFNHWDNTSLANQISTNIDNALNGKTAGATTQNLFSTYNPPNTFVYNTSVWTGSWDFTGVSAWSNQSNAPNPCAVLVSPRHVTMTNHYHLGIGTQVSFVAADGTVATRTITGYNFPAGNYDIAVGILDSDVPSNIHFLKVMPTTWRNYLPACLYFYGNATFKGHDNGYVYPLPLICFNQNRTIGVRQVQYISNSGDVAQDQFGTNSTSTWSIFATENPTGTQRNAFIDNIIGGDSSSPCVVVVNGQTVLLTQWTTLGSDHIGAIAPALNAAMHSLSVAAGAATDYQLTAVDLSGFPTY